MLLAACRSRGLPNLTKLQEVPRKCLDSNSDYVAQGPGCMQAATFVCFAQVLLMAACLTAAGASAFSTVSSMSRSHAHTCPPAPAFHRRRARGALIHHWRSAGASCQYADAMMRTKMRMTLLVMVIMMMMMLADADIPVPLTRSRVLPAECGS